MAEHALGNERGSVGLELMLVMPLVLLFLAFVLEAERTLRSNWVSLAAARNSVWIANRAGEMPEAGSVEEALRGSDGRMRSIELTKVPATEAGGSLDGLIGTILSGLPGPFSKLDDSHLAGVGVRACAHVGARWGELEHDAYLSARTGCASDIMITDDDYQSAVPMGAALGLLSF
jgi:hypothetical protein